ncbi:uncharacterized protein LOC121632161 isoform X3 [Melanotaenia boesemani]|nr:uncharacterized protein LOC121632161 isoform X2 [Melanotaenia boesemani]XP_041829314.1 uncharacterized protein LOC121632161 isoform X3 [Melanotaenia boesemani]
MVMELSGRVSWICLLFGLAAGFPADGFPYMAETGLSSPSEYSSTEQLSPSSSEEAGSFPAFWPRSSSLITDFSSDSTDISPRSWYTAEKTPVQSGSGSSNILSRPGYGLVFGGSGSGVFSAGDAALGVFQDLSSLGSNLQDARQMSLGEAWNNNNQVAFGSVAGYPHYAVSHVVHYNSGYQRARDGRTDQKYVKDTSGHIPLPEIHLGQKGGTGSKGQQVQRG